MPATTRKPAKTTTTSAKSSSGFTAEERAAMKEHGQELKAAQRRAGKADKAAEDERDVLAKIAEMSDSDRAMGQRIHEVVTTNAPELTSRLWYGQPAYAKDGKIVCFFQAADKFKTRYATLGFTDAAHLDEGSMWTTAFALTKLTKSDEKRILDLVKRAVG